MERTEKIIITHTLGHTGDPAYKDYLSHALCTGGRCTFRFNGKEFERVYNESCGWHLL